MTFPLFPQDAGGQQIGFLLGSCGIALALTTEVCLKGLPKTQNGEIVQFKGELVTDWLLIVLQLQLSCLKGAVRTLKALEGQRGNSWSHHQNAVGFVLVLRSTHVSDTGVLGVTRNHLPSQGYPQVPSVAFGRFQGSFIHKLYLGMLQGSSLRRGSTLLPTELPGEKRDEPSGW